MENNNLYGYSSNVNGFYSGQPMMQGQGQIQYVVHVDLAAIMSLMVQVWQMGMNEQKRDVMPQATVPNENIQAYLGIYDQYAYGVYNDEAAFKKSQSYWNQPTVQTQLFNNYDEAVAYAKNGVASLRNVAVNSLPPLKNNINWRQAAYQNTNGRVSDMTF